MFARVLFLGVSAALLLTSLVTASGAALPNDPVGVLHSPAPLLFSDVQIAKVSGWIRASSPGCRSGEVNAAALQFLETLKARQPERFDQLLSAESPSHEFESELFRDIAVALTEPSETALRETVAKKRVQQLLIEGNIVPAASEQDASRAIDKMKAVSPVYYRRLVDGRFDDADLLPLLKRAGRADEAHANAKSTAPKVLSGADIVSEFTRRNQTGSAVQRLRAYTVEATLTTASGTKQNLVLSRLRPDRFRLVVKSEGKTQLIMGSSGHGFWQQLPNTKPVEISRTAMDSKALLGEFINPLFTEEGYTFEKFEDGLCDGRKVYRIAVRRADGSNYVSCLDTAEFREVGRENGGRLNVHYSDCRDVAGVTFAFREEMKDEQGRTALLEVERVSVNPGLVQMYFEPTDPVDPNYFAVEQWLNKPGATVR